MQSPAETVLEDQESEDNFYDEDENEDKDHLDETPEPIEEPKDPGQEFRDRLNSIIERLQQIPDDIEEIKLPEVKRDSKSIYLRLCSALNVPISSEFLRNIDNDEMDFSHHSLGENGVVALTKALVPNASVKRLDLSFNSLGARCLPAVTSLLNQNEHISYLNLSNNGIGKYNGGVVGALVSVCHSVQVLNLSGNSLGDEELTEIGRSLLEIDSVIDLNLSRNDFGPSQCAAAFGASIAKCTALERLDLSDNRLEEGAKPVFASLRHSNLKYLNLSRNGIPDDATPPVSAGLKNSQTMLELDLTGNYITEKGTKPLAAGLRGSASLEIMRLAFNPIDPTGATRLVKCIGSSLKILDLTGIKGDVLFMKFLRKAPETAQVLFGPEIRFGIYPPRDYRSPRAESITPENAVRELQKLADDKGVSLKHALRSLHAVFLVEKAAEEDSDVHPEEPKLRHMGEKEFARALSESDLSAPRALAQELAAALCVDGVVNVWDLMAKLQWRPDDVAVRIKTKKPTPKDDKKKGKGKK